jgi:tubulin polyglutamylase TTLL1
MSTAMFKAAALKIAAAHKDKADEDKAEATKQRATHAEPKRIKFKADIERGVVITIFERNGWSRTEGDDWQVGWFTVSNIRAMFHPDSGIRFGDQQMVNHYPNHYELTRKDNMVKNIKRYMRDSKGAADDVEVRWATRSMCPSMIVRAFLALCRCRFGLIIIIAKTG